MGRCGSTLEDFMFHRETAKRRITGTETGRGGGPWLPSAREEVGQERGSLPSGHLRPQHLVSLFPLRVSCSRSVPQPGLPHALKGRAPCPVSVSVPDQSLHFHAANVSFKMVQAACPLMFMQRRCRPGTEMGAGVGNPTRPSSGASPGFPVMCSPAPGSPPPSVQAVGLLSSAPLSSGPCGLGARPCFCGGWPGSLGAPQRQETRAVTGIIYSVSGTLLYPPHPPVPWENLARGESLSLRVMGGGIFPNNLS